MYGIRVNMKMMDGNRARKKLNAMDEALNESAPSYKPFQKNRATSYSGTLSKPGIVIFLARIAIIKPILLNLFFNDILKLKINSFQAHVKTFNLMS